MTELATSVATQLVPASYAEKAMASLMQLHSELMDEKERRVDLFRRLMEREQALAELKMYVKVLEEQARGRTEAPRPENPAPSPLQVSPPATPTPPSSVRSEARRAPPVVPLVGQRRGPEGWKSW